ncbi:MAG: C4-type zinc ribbon domain-containing protein [Thermodesulfobacteriota bacterium]
MQEQLNHLIRMQQVDKTIQQLLFTTEQNPVKIKEVDLEIQEAEETFRNFTHDLEDMKKQRKSLERDIEEFDQKIKKSQVKLMEVKTNKEYKAMLTEADELKKAKTGKEDLLLEFIEKLEEGVRKEKILKNELEIKVNEGRQKKKKLEEEGQEIGQELQALKEKRQEICSRVEGSLLQQYEFLRERLKGTAVAEVKNGTCLGCHMHIPPQLFNELHRQDRIIPCPSCLRILYLVGSGINKEP